MSIKRPEADEPRQIWSWAFYDWANSAFATVVMAGFFPVFFKQYWALGKNVNDSSFLLGSANSLASILVVICAPVLGAIADHGGAKKRFLMVFTILGVLATSSLYLVASGSWLTALMLYIFAVLGFSGSNIFYDAFLVDVAKKKGLDRVSALGFAVGYLGGGLLFAFDMVMVSFPEAFGLSDAASAVKISFLTVGIWWAIFSLPLLFFVREAGGRESAGWREHIRGGMSQLASTFKSIRQLRMTFLFLLAYWLYIDGVDTVIRMAVDYGLSLNFESSDLLLALLLTQLVGFPAALLFGRLGERYGPRRGILIAIGVYMLVILWAYQMQSVWEFFVLASAIGLVQGGIQALSRSFYARLIPPDQTGEFFGFFNMMGKFAAVAGPFMMGWVSMISGDTRLSILSLLLLFVAGAVLLLLVDEDEGRRQAHRMQQKAG